MAAAENEMGLLGALEILCRRYRQEWPKVTFTASLEPGNRVVIRASGSEAELRKLRFYGFKMPEGGEK